MESSSSPKAYAGLDAKFVKGIGTPYSQPSVQDAAPLSPKDGRHSPVNSAQEPPPQLSTSLLSFPRSNIGFKLLKKSGWKEGSGLGAAGQGRLDPLETNAKHDRRGIGADAVKRKDEPMSKQKSRKKDNPEEKEEDKGRGKQTLSKKARKAQAIEEQIREQAFQRDFFKEFWPENV